MISDTIAKLEAKLKDTSLSPRKRRELLELLNRLKTEVNTLSRTHRDEAESIAGFAEAATREATRARKNPKLVDLSMQALTASVAGFEKSHPRLVEVVNRICTTLASLGI